jgi:hypothetical protein
MSPDCFAQETFKTFGIGHFVLALHDAEISSAAELKACSDELLMSGKVGMKKAHVIKFRRATAVI